MSATDATEETSPGTGTGAGIISFLGYLIRKNEMVESTASALRTGCRKVLEVDADWRDLDIRSLDVDGLLLRFRNKYRGELAERSIANYEQRFRSTVDMYRKWLDDDPAWRPRGRNGNTAARRPSAPPSEDVPARSLEPQRLLQEETTVSAGPAMLVYPLPVRPGVRGRLEVPEDLTPAEAQRIAKIVAALAVEERRAITAGTTSPEASLPDAP